MATVPRPWSQEEDNLLRQAVVTHGEEPGVWKIIASTIPGRSNKACRKRWLHSLSPTVRKAPWTPAEDALLLELYAAHSPPRWSLIAKRIPGRTDDACSKRYREALDPLLKKDSWSEEEDNHLLELTSQLGTKWTQVGQAMGRSGLGCRNRWRLLQRKQRSKKNAQEPRATSYFEQQHDEDHSFMQTQVSFDAESALLSTFSSDQRDGTLHDCGRIETSNELLSSSLYSNRANQSSLPCGVSTIEPLGQVLEYISSASLSSHNWHPDPSMRSSSFRLFPSSHSSLSTSPSSSDDSQLHISTTEPSPLDMDMEYSTPEQINYGVITERLESCTTVSSEISPASSSIRPEKDKHLSKRSFQNKRLCAHLPANTERTILPYACGHPFCWPSSSSHGMSNFATASDLAEHRRLAHGRDSDPQDGKEKPFRCALEGCGKGWKNINGIQYHLQISKAHFQNALQKHTVGPVNENGENACFENSQPILEDIPDLNPKERGKIYQCPKEGCSNSYKQRTGLAYHLAHGHPIDLAQLDVIPPALLRKMSSTGETSIDTRN